MVAELINVHSKGLFIEGDVAVGSAVASVTADAGADNGYSGCCKSKFPGATSHPTTSTAITNLINSFTQSSVAVNAAATKQGLPWIIGHGASGYLTTGCGQGASSDENRVATWNEGTWGNLFALLQKVNYPILTILSCDTGAGEDGADLLFAIAKRTKRQVRARTGLTFCGGAITYEQGSTWQIATPDHRPNPISEPSFISQLEVPMDMKLTTDEGFEDVPISAVSEVTVTRINRFLDERSTRAHVTLDENDLTVLLQLVDFSNPFQPGMPAAILTSKIDVVFKDERYVRRQFNVYNDRLLQDVENPSVFYTVAPGFSQMLRMMF
ncbi:hypothetical protein H6F89_11070 [Cyanobacteria bacterium FACHB-63]|nr:hypothetical protein [Cyanobacteria bacterium FACHB-63]